MRCSVLVELDLRVMSQHIATSLRRTRTNAASPEKTGLHHEGDAQSEVIRADAAEILRWLDAHNAVLPDDCRQAILSKLESAVCGSTAVVE